MGVRTVEGRNGTLTPHPPHEATLTANLRRELPRTDLLLVYKSISTRAPAHDGKSYPGMVVVGEIVNWV
jgi:hypothetical protein